jgi:4-hydroxythreonine-4-phosphate dehydrogenase
VIYSATLSSTLGNPHQGTAIRNTEKQCVAPLAVTMGEPAGVGGELTLAAWARRNTDQLPPFFVLDDPQRLISLARKLSVEVPIVSISSPEEVAMVFDRALPILKQELYVESVPGKPDPANSGAVIASIEKATALALAQRIGGIVTNPIHKETLIDAGFTYPGHTEFLAALTGGTPIMMLASSDLKVVPMTTHVALKNVPGLLTVEKIIECGQIIVRALINDFGISTPRLAIAALNPHAGEGGIFGSEEQEIIKPAMQVLAAEGIQVTGPHPADSLFRAEARKGYDAVLCMYHDQALIPLKTLDFERGVNVTLGLPIVRTSPDHGTALDLAGTGKASAQGLIAALILAANIAQSRADTLAVER